MTDLAPTQTTRLELVAAARRGEAAALGVLYREQAGVLLRGATVLLQSRSDAEDLVHDLFVGLPEALRKYEERGALGAWLASVATQMALMRLRSRKRRGEVDLERAEGRCSPSNAERLANRLLVEQALARLPDDSRIVIVLRELHGWSYGDIAELAGERTGAIMTRHSRAMERLRLALEELK